MLLQRCLYIFRVNVNCNLIIEVKDLFHFCSMSTVSLLPHTRLPVQLLFFVTCGYGVYHVPALSSIIILINVLSS